MSSDVFDAPKTSDSDSSRNAGSASVPAGVGNYGRRDQAQVTPREVTILGQTDAEGSKNMSRHFH